MWFIGVEVQQETSAPPPKKNPGSAPDTTKKCTYIHRRTGGDTEIVSANYCGPKVVNIHIKKLCLEIGLFLTPIDHSRKYHNIP